MREIAGLANALRHNFRWPSDTENLTDIAVAIGLPHGRAYTLRVITWIWRMNAAIAGVGQDDDAFWALSAVRVNGLPIANSHTRL